MANITILYPQGTKFNLDYYNTKHMPMVQEKWGPYGLTGWRVLSFPDDAPYTIQATLLFGSVEEFQKASESPEAKDVMGDIPEFSDKQPIIMPGKVLKTSS